MKNISIKFKVLSGVLACLIAGTIVVIMTLHFSYKSVIDDLALSAVVSSRHAFNNLKQNDTDKLSATLQVLLEDSKYQEAFINGDKAALYNLALPLFTGLKADFGITHWYFLNNSKDGTCFLRVHNRAKNGDKITRFTYQNSIKSGSFASGIELGKTAFALRVVHPYRINGKIAGYMELGEEIDHFFDIMKKETGNEYGLLVEKKYLDKSKWASVRKTKNLTDNWDEFSSKVLINSTTPDEQLLKYNGKITDVDDEGVVLEEIGKNGKNYVRGIFPLYDAGDRKVGAVFVLQDVTDIYTRIMAAQTQVVVTVLIIMVLISLIIIFMTNSLIFKRLEHITVVATKVVGGDFESKIHVSSNDEIGRFESLFEKFRVVFVNTLKEIDESSEHKE